MAIETSQRQEMTYADWIAEGKRRFGEDNTRWRFVCPCCGHVASTKDWLDAGAQNAIAFSCVGRWVGAEREAFGEGEGPCNYAGGGLFALNPIKVTLEDGRVHHVFAFAPVEGEASHA